jgi:hypothetical protein
LNGQASCRRCANRTDEKPPFCHWLLAETPTDLADDPDCEGFAPKRLGTSKGRACPNILAARHNQAEPLPVEGLRKNGAGSAEFPKATICPKNPEIQAALKLKAFKGSVVMERICCGKPGCRCHSGALHGPYPYLHYYSNGKVRRRYLSKTMNALLSHSREELEKMLLKTEAVLEQQEKGSHG